MITVIFLAYSEKDWLHVLGFILNLFFLYLVATSMKTALEKLNIKFEDVVDDDGISRGIAQKLKCAIIF